MQSSKPKKLIENNKDKEIAFTFFADNMSSNIDYFGTNLATRGVIFLYFFSLFSAFFALYLAVSESQLIGAANLWILGLLVVVLLLIFLFCFMLWNKFSQSIPRGKLDGAGTKIHVRYVRLFMLAAAIPSVIIAAFSGLTIGRGVQAWLSGQVKTAIGATRELGTQQVSQISNDVKVEILAMAADLNAASSQFNANNPLFEKYLADQADRRGFVAVYLIDRKNNIIAKAERPNGAPKRTQEENDDFITADAGDISFNLDEKGVANALFRLSAFNDLYIQAIKLAPDNVIQLLRQAKQVSDSYRIIEQRQAQIQTVFALGFLETAILVIIGAGWIGLNSATRISMPIAQLAVAAQSIREGDYSVRINPETKVEELSTLTNTFNDMTQDLESQKIALEQSKEEALSRSAFIQAVLEGVSAGVISLDKDFNVKTANVSAAKLLGVSQEDLIKNGLFEIAPEFMEIAKTTRLTNISKGHVERDLGNNILVFDVKSAFAGDDIILTFDEVSSQIASQRQAAWRDVARRIAHEIKNPLTPIQLSAERLSRKFGKQITSENDLFNNLTQTIVRQVTDIGRMVDEFSSFARMPTPKFQIDDICEIIRQTVFSQKIAFPNVEYSLSAPPEQIPVSMDARLISQAILNILKNAAESVTHYATQTSENFTSLINVIGQIENNNVIITIEDNGAGFPKQDRSKLLEPYVTTRAKGTGLGLAIVARIFEEHKGSIKLTDRNDGQRGAAVILTLPVADTKPQVE